MRFSICVPAYKTEKYINQCIDSIISQTFSDFEIIIVDDGSPDNVGKIADEYAQKDTRIHVIHQENMGLFHARISAIKAAKGEYIIHIDSDDWIESECLATINNIIEKDDVDIVIINDYIAYENGQKKEEIALGREDKVWIGSDEYKVLFFNTSLIHSICKKVVRRDIIEINELASLPRITMTEDWIHSFYPIIRSRSAAYIAEPLYNYRMKDGSMTALFDPLIYDSSKIIYHLRKEYQEQNVVGNYVMPEKWFLVKISKSLVYYRAIVKDKKVYINYLKTIVEDDEFHGIYERGKGSVSLLYRIPLALLLSRKYEMLYFLKTGIAKIRQYISR